MRTTGGIRVGELRDRITIQAPTFVADGQGGRTTTWGALATSIPASVLPIIRPEFESIQGGELTAQLRSIIRIRARDDLSVTHRVVFEGRTLQIEQIRDPNGWGTQLELFCSEVQA